MYAHQEPKSMNGSLKDIAVDVLSKQGYSVTVSDLYTMKFIASATRNDITGKHESVNILHNFVLKEWRGD